MEQGICRIETEFGVFDCGLDTELKNLYKDIRSLCS
jgi:flagellar biosynthesis/type III secretory pathway protein FliH